MSEINLLSEGECLLVIQLTIAQQREVQDTVIFDISPANDIYLTLAKRCLSCLHFTIRNSSEI
jgi:hypothetical protein